MSGCCCQPAIQGCHGLLPTHPCPSRLPPLPVLCSLLQRGLLVNDTIVIRYQIELVVSSGGALSRSTSKPPPPQIHVPPPNLGLDLASLLQSGVGADVQFEVEGEEMAAHKIILQVGVARAGQTRTQSMGGRGRAGNRVPCFLMALLCLV